MRVHLDFETRSEVKIAEVGAWAYSMHPSTRVLCYAYAIDDGPVIGSSDVGPTMWCNMNPEVRAHNATFEYYIWLNVLHRKNGWVAPPPPEKFVCTMAKAQSHGLPAALEKCSKALGLAEKDMEGSMTMLRLCKPLNQNAVLDKGDEPIWDDDPKKLDRLVEYCRQDIVTEREVDRRLPDISEEEQRVFALTLRMNIRGISADIPAVTIAKEFAEKLAGKAGDEISKMTGGTIFKATQHQRILKWLNERSCMIPNLRKETIEEWIANEFLESDIERMLMLRYHFGVSSVSKFSRILGSHIGGRVRDYLIYWGALTGRWASNAIQMQNLPKGSVKDIDTCFKLLMQNDLDYFETFTSDPMGALCSMIRGMFVPAEGKDFLSADYNAIEARMIMWLAGAESGLEVFRSGNKDIYVEMAKIIYDDPTITGADKEKRALGKQAVLGCGYGMGHKKFRATCAKYHIKISEDLAKKAVASYRSTYPEVVEFWYAQERAAVKAIRTLEPVECKGILWAINNGFLYCGYVI